MHKESLAFGGGSFVTALNDPAFEALAVRDQARIVGWADGCPVVNELTDPSNPDPQRGPATMLGRYGQVNMWFGFIARTAGEVNANLSAQLLSPVSRLSAEPVGPYEPESVPDTYGTKMAPMATLPGYALPRLLVKQLGNGPVPDTQARLCRGLEALDNAVSKAATPAELLALFADGLYVQKDISAEAILSSAFSKGWFDEHNASTLLSEVKAAFADKAPELWTTYTSLSVAAKSQLKLV